LAQTSLTGGGCSVGIVRLRTKATEFSLVLVHILEIYVLKVSEAFPQDAAIVTSQSSVLKIQ